MTQAEQDVIDAVLAEWRETNVLLARLVKAAERLSPLPAYRPMGAPAGEEHLTRPSLKEQAEWERDDRSQRDGIF